MSFVCFILFWNTLSLCSDIVYKTKEFQPTFQNSKLKFVKLDKIYFLLSGNLFSDWQQIFRSTSNIREINQSGVELWSKISCFKPMLLISNIEHRNSCFVSVCYIMAVCLYSVGCRRGNVSHHLGYTASITFLLNLVFVGT